MNKLLFYGAIILLPACNGVRDKNDKPATTANREKIVKFSEKVRKVVECSPLEVLVDKSYLTGHFDYRKHPDFIKVPRQLGNRYIYIRKEVLLAFEQMYLAAKAEKCNLHIISGTRSFKDQKLIWERKWESLEKSHQSNQEVALEILQYSSMPATSRHHWGTDLDINALKNSYFEEGKGLQEYVWLRKNAQKFGFYQVYDKETEGRTGYKEEKWHWSYLPLSNQFHRQYLSQLTNNDINDFKGAETAIAMNMVDNYVNGVNVFR